MIARGASRRSWSRPDWTAQPHAVKKKGSTQRAERASSAVASSYRVKVRVRVRVGVGVKVRGRLGVRVRVRVRERVRVRVRVKVRVSDGGDRLLMSSGSSLFAPAAEPFFFASLPGQG